MEDNEKDAGWDWDGIFSYMKKVRIFPQVKRYYELTRICQSEGFSAPNDQQKDKGADSVEDYHNTSGPVQVTFPDDMYGGPQQKAFVDTITSLVGIEHVPDLNGGNTNAVAFTPVVSRAFTSSKTTCANKKKCFIDDELATGRCSFLLCNSLL